VLLGNRINLAAKGGASAPPERRRPSNDKKGVRGGAAERSEAVRPPYPLITVGRSRSHDREQSRSWAVSALSRARNAEGSVTKRSSITLLVTSAPGTSVLLWVCYDVSLLMWHC